MRVHVPIVIVTLLFSFGGVAFSGKAAQENGTTPLPQATPSSNVQRYIDQPVQGSAPKGAETPSPGQVPSQQLALSADLEKSLAGLTTAVTKLVEKQSKPESGWGKLLGILMKVVGVLVSIIGCGVGFFGFRREGKPNEKKLDKNFDRTETAIRTLFVLAVVIVGLCLVSGVIQAALYVLFGLIMLLVALLIAAAHLVTFIDNNYDLKVRVRKHFPQLFDENLAGQPSNSGDSLSGAAPPAGSSGG